jgi:hypothetical protein
MTAMEAHRPLTAAFSRHTHRLFHVTSTVTRDWRFALDDHLRVVSSSNYWPWWLLWPKMGSRHETNSSAVRKRIENRMFQYQGSVCSYLTASR